MKAQLEHVNVTVSEPARTAEMMCALFDWRVRWKGASQMGGQSIHVGTDDAYVAVYSPGETQAGGSTHNRRGGLNHIGVVVDDLDATEKRVLARGYETFAHGDYEPGRRFYFKDGDDIEFEVVSYS